MQVNWFILYIQRQRNRMGATCIGKGKKSQTKKIDNKSNTVSSEMHSNEEVILHHSKEIRLPVITLSSYKHYPILMHSEKLYRNEFKLEKEYRYQQVLQFRKDKLVSSHTISQFSQKRIEQKHGQSGWSQCSTLQRQFYQCNAIVLHNGNTYIKMSDVDKQTKQNQNKIEQGQIEVNLSQQVYPKKLLLISIEANLNETMQISQRTYQILQQQDIQIITRQILQTNPNFQYFYTPFLSGVAFTQPNQLNKQLTDNYILQIFALKASLTQSTVLLLYANQIQKSMIEKAQFQGKLQTYFQIYYHIKQKYGDVWHSDISSLSQLVQKHKLQAFLAIQFLRCIVDSVERSHLISGKHLLSKQSISEKRSKIIQSFLFMDQSAIKPLIFIANSFFALQGFNQQQSEQGRTSILKAIACQLTIICDGLFHQFGYEINQKDHYYKLQSYYFIKNKNQKKSIRHLNKNVQYPHHQIINHIKNLLIRVTNPQITEQQVEGIRINFLKDIQDEVYKEYLSISINEIFVQDFLIRLKLVELYLAMANGKLVEYEWKSIQDHINLIQYIAPQTMLVYFTLGGLISTTLKLNIERTQAEEYYYLKALELAHKIYGDPRTNRANMPIEKQQTWQLLILQNYSALFKGSFEKKQFHYLNNIYQCLKEDIKTIYPLLQCMQDEDPHKRLIKMMDYLPIKCITGIFYRRSLVFDSENQDLRSNYSQSLSSSSCKKTNRTSYKINQSQFSLKLSLYSGIIRWGHNIAGQPHILPPLKNKQVIVISSGNYHTVFLTQSGIFGWGENYSSQLGSHNKEKNYLKETICIKQMKINRNKDKYQISCGNQHTAVLINGVLLMWGQSQGGILAGNGYTFDFISCGGLHTLAIREGIVFSWGRGQGGQLGHPLHALNQKKKEETTQYFIDVPSPIRSIPSLAVKVACGDAHSLVLTIEGKVYVFGFCYQGQLGLGLTGQNENFQIFEPQQQSYFKQKIIDIFAGPTFSFFKNEKQQVYSCGINDCLQLGIDRVLKVFQKKKYLNRTVELNRRKLGQQQFSKPRRIDMFNSQFNLNLIHLQCGQNHCLALVRYMGQQVMLMGWGLNKNYQIDSQLNETTTPRTLDSFYSLQISQICCGSTYSLANIGKLLMTDEQLTQFLKDVHCQSLHW